ncbi:hypothetical protein T484DRAFT_1977291 [Baffinella frigidus]|nr:hypothetical protein T484DRAFT_1977291 [Cryptophyta sp. CCMP2293]
MQARSLLTRAARVVRPAAAQARSLAVTPVLRAADPHGPGHQHDDGYNGWLFGKDPSKSHEREAWEIPYYIASVLTVTILFFGLTYKPKTSIKVWAQGEVDKMKGRV